MHYYYGICPTCGQSTYRWPCEDFYRHTLDGTGVDAHIVPASRCPVCQHRATAYGLGPCDAHSGDVWAGAR